MSRRPRHQPRPPRGSPRSPAGPSGTPSQAVPASAPPTRLAAQRRRTPRPPCPRRRPRRSRPVRRVVARTSGAVSPRYTSKPLPHRLLVVVRARTSSAAGWSSQWRPSRGGAPCQVVGPLAHRALAPRRQPPHQLVLASPRRYSTASSRCPRSASSASSASACGTVRGKPSSTKPARRVRLAPCRSRTSPIITSSGTSCPASICRRASSPSGVPLRHRLAQDLAGRDQRRSRSAVGQPASLRALAHARERRAGPARNAHILWRPRIRPPFTKPS